MGKYFKIWNTYKIIYDFMIICDPKNTYVVFLGFQVNNNAFSLVLLRDTYESGDEREGYSWLS